MLRQRVEFFPDLLLRGVHPRKNLFAVLAFRPFRALRFHLLECPHPDFFKVLPELLYVLEFALYGLARRDVGFQLAARPLQKRYRRLRLLCDLQTLRRFRPESPLVLFYLVTPLNFRDLLRNHMGRHNELKRQHQHQEGRAFLPQRKRIMLFRFFPTSSFAFHCNHDRSPRFYFMFSFFLADSVQEVVEQCFHLAPLLRRWFPAGGTSAAEALSSPPSAVRPADAPALSSGISARSVLSGHAAELPRSPAQSHGEAQ